MPLLAAEHEVGCVPPQFNRDEPRGEKNLPNKFENKTKTWKLLQILKVLSTTYAMMVNAVALFALHVCGSAVYFCGVLCTLRLFGL